MGKGKLCRAVTKNALGQTDYNRLHSYDTQGRPSTTSTKLDITVTTSVSYEAATGRVTSKTYPTGYIASYQYTQLGYVKTVTGQGAGTTKIARYDVLAINAQGQITSYKYGNQVITNKTYNTQTGRLETITATNEGLATGGIQNNSYEYDSLSNLTKRVDHFAAGTGGVQETFGYDPLNRLTNYTAIGGAITAQDPSNNVDVRYDPRGNITCVRCRQVLLRSRPPQPHHQHHQHHPRSAGRSRRPLQRQAPPRLCLRRLRPRRQSHGQRPHHGQRLA